VLGRLDLMIARFGSAALLTSSQPIMAAPVNFDRLMALEISPGLQ